MGLDYALVHVKYTIPPAIALTYIFRPLQTRLDTYKLIFILTIAILATIPWDSYLLAKQIWGYPPEAVLGYTFMRIPVEELFFFFIQTYNTALLYMLFNKPVLHVAYLHQIRGNGAGGKKMAGIVGGLLLAGSIAKAAELVYRGAEGTYLGLIWIWAGPVVLFIWCISYSHILSIPLRTTLIPITISTAYLWVIDHLALQKGTWVINTGTKFDIQLPFSSLELEEAVFFTVTNILIVWGLATSDYATALYNAFPSRFPNANGGRAMLWSFVALFTRRLPAEDEYRGIPEAVDVLRRKSRSFYLASAVFEGRLRLDLISLYSFCRAADDLIDEAPTTYDASVALSQLQKFLSIAYTHPSDHESYVISTFPTWSHAPLLALPHHKLPRPPLDALLEGFKMDLGFSNSAKKTTSWPIHTESDLQMYAHRVAGTVGEMFTHLVLLHAPPTSERDYLLKMAETMGIALQYVNISRDIAKDAAISRVYIPTEWLKEDALRPEDVIQNPDVGLRYRSKLLKMADELYRESREAIERLPTDARNGARVAVESYMNIGRRLERGDYVGVKGTSKWRSEGRGTKAVRMWGAWKVLRQ